MSVATDDPGTVYILHLDPPYRHARHYTGNPESSRFLKVQRAGCRGEFAGLTARMCAAVELIEQPATYPSRRDPGQRVYPTPRITQMKGGRR